MAINLETMLGQRYSGNASKKASQDDRPRAQFWLNIGYTTEVEGDNGLETRFVSLPTGIPLDTQEMLKTNSSNEVFAAFQAARNDLLEQLLEVCNKLEPGEEKLIGLGNSGMSIQLRRVNDEKAPVKAADNQFVKRLAFA